MPCTSEWTRVIVLAPPPETGGPAALSEGLRSQFAARDWFAVLQHDPYLAMTELCLRERAQTARSAWGLQRMEQLALVILGMERWDQADGLVDAVRANLPAASVWQADFDDNLTSIFAPSISASQFVPEEASQPLSQAGSTTERSAQDGPFPFEDSSLAALWPQQRAAAAGSGASQMMRSHAEPPMLRLAGEAPFPPEQDAESAAGKMAGPLEPADEDGASERSGRLSREEIDMLLQMDLPDSSAGVPA